MSKRTEWAKEQEAKPIVDTVELANSAIQEKQNTAMRWCAKFLQSDDLDDTQPSAPNISEISV